MWSTKLTNSYQQIAIFSIFYLMLVILCLLQFAHTTLNSYTFIVTLILVIEWFRALRYCKTIKGEFALFHHINQIYWHKQRWYLLRKPLLLRYMIILNLQSRHNGKRCTLLLMTDHLIPNDWRTLRYYLFQIKLID